MKDQSKQDLEALRSAAQRWLRPGLALRGRRAQLETLGERGLEFLRSHPDATERLLSESPRLCRILLHNLGRIAVRTLLAEEIGDPKRRQRLERLVDGHSSRRGPTTYVTRSDICQEGITAIVRSLEARWPSFETEAALDAYVRKSVRNAYLSQVRSSTRERERRATQSGNDALDTLVGDAATPDVELDQRSAEQRRAEDAVDLQRRIAGLDQPLRIVARLRCDDGKSWTQLADLWPDDRSPPQARQSRATRAKWIQREVEGRLGLSSGGETEQDGLAHG